MDTEDEHNSYLKYLNDSDTPNTYLLENNEVGLFSVEPIFNEMEANDWPQEGFPLLLTNSFITQEECNTPNQMTSHLASDHSARINEDSKGSKDFHDNINNSELGDSNSKGSECQELDERVENNIKKEGINDNTSITQKELTIDGNDEAMVTETYTQFNTNNGYDENTTVSAAEERIGDLEVEKMDAVVKLEPNKNYVLIKTSHINKQTRTVQLIDSEGTPIAIDNSLLATISLPTKQKKGVAAETKLKSVNDLFSTVIANKCKICSFLCEDLEQIKKHISAKHPEFIFTHNGLSNGVSLLLSNVNNKVQSTNGANKEFTIYVCSECRGVCTNKSDLKCHMIQMHSEEANRMIGEASATLTRDTMMQEKSRTTEAESLLNKTIGTIENKPDKKVSTYLDDVNVGMVKKQEGALQRVKCTVKGCNAGFPTEELRNKHEKLHIGDTKSMFKCSECDKTFMMWTITRTHMYNEHGVDFGMIVCPMCHVFKSYRSVRVLKHMMIHSEVRPFLCSDCGKSFKQLAQLKNHEVIHKLPEDMPTWCKVKKCDKCERFFSNSKSLKTHIKTIHENLKPFICNICGHKSSRKAMLELHTRQHTASKPHKCEYCDFRTGDHNSLRKHVMKHLGTVRYQCPYCQYSCIQAGSIKTHLMRRHKNRAGVYHCNYCTFTSINESFLKAHEKIHESKGALRSDQMSGTERTNGTDELQTDEETQSCFLNTESQTEETVDNGGITIPAGLEMPSSS